MLFVAGVGPESGLIEDTDVNRLLQNLIHMNCVARDTFEQPNLTAGSVQGKSGRV